MEAMSTYQVCTQGTCFLCRNNERDTGGSTPWSFLELSRLVKVNYAAAFNLPSSSGMGMSSEEAREETDIIVPLCSGCSPLLNQFCELYKELEKIKLKLNTSVQNIHDVLRNAEEQSDRFQKNQRQRVSRNPVEMMNCTISENIRMEIMRKCSVHVESNPCKDNVDIIELVENPDSQGLPSSTPKSPEKTESKIEIQKSVSQASSVKSGTSASSEIPSQSRIAFEGKTALTCATCGKIFKSHNNVKRHIRTNTGEKSYKCSHCPYRFDIANRLHIHEVKYHLGDMLKENKDKEMSTARFDKAVASLVEENIRKVSREKKYACGILLIKYSKLVVCKFHLITNHRQEMASKLLALKQPPPLEKSKLKRSKSHHIKSRKASGIFQNVSHAVKLEPMDIYD